MKHLKTFNEATSYLNLHGDDEYEIEEVKQDSSHDYEYCNGVMYELSNGGDDRIVSIGMVEHTPENSFYDEQVERYMEYINDGGILQTFPVVSSKLASNLDEMLTYLDDEEDGFDIAYDLFNKRPHNNIIDNERMSDINGSFYDIIMSPEEYGFYDENETLSNIKTIKDLHEAYFDFSDEKPNGDDEDDMEEWEEKFGKFDKDILRGLEDIMKYFFDEEEYTLNDFNHRFAALVKLGKTDVYVEVI